MVEAAVKETHAERESTTLETGSVYLRGDIETIDPSKSGSLYVFDWTEEPGEQDIPIGELRRLRTCFEKDGLETIDHRVLVLDANEYVKEKIREKLLKREGLQSEKDIELRESLERQLELVERNKDKPPIILIPDFTGGPLLDQAWPFALTGRRVIMLSYPEYPGSNCSESSIDKWNDASDYVPFYRKVLAQLGVDEFDAAGWSSGAAIVAALAAPDLKDRARKLVLHNPGGVYKQRGIRIPLAMIRESGWFLTKRAKEIGTDQFFKPIEPPLLPVEEGAGQKRRLPGNLPTMPDIKRGTLISSSRAIVDELTDKQILIVASEKDRVFPPKKLRKAAEDRKGLKVVTAMGHGHAGVKTDEAIGATILRWLDEEEEESPKVSV
jgi:pimeloyl-ACP methyl ester carboxylesterase